MHDKKWNASYLKYLKKVSKGVRRCNNLLPKSSKTFLLQKRRVFDSERLFMQHDVSSQDRLLSKTLL